MKFHEFGNKNRPHIMLIHGGGNAWWNYLRQAEVLSNKYHVILPTLDGHGEEYETTYISTEDTADKLISYIDENCSGHLFALVGYHLVVKLSWNFYLENLILLKKQLLMVVFATQDLLWQGFVLLVFDFLEDFCLVRRLVAFKLL
ncbi:alpha/beta hydrolase family protein [Clostridioides difficile CD43]|nr:alpha/beta hydrolase family protein [Clostridioides difficile CD43]